MRLPLRPPTLRLLLPTLQRRLRPMPLLLLRRRSSK
jgi:hypothetical protein